MISVSKCEVCGKHVICVEAADSGAVITFASLMNNPSFLSELHNTIEKIKGGDPGQLRQAEQAIDEWDKSNIEAYSLGLAQIIGSPNADPHTRSLSCVLLNATLSGKDKDLNTEKQLRWKTIPAQTRLEIKKILIERFSEQFGIARMIAQTVSKIAIIEIPAGEWPEIMPLLLSAPQSNCAHTLQTSIETIGLICETLDNKIIAPLTPQLVPMMISLLTPNPPNSDISLAAASAIYNSLDYVLSDSTYISNLLRALLEAMKIPEEQLQLRCLSILIDVASLKYEYLSDSMPLIYTMTMTAMQDAPDDFVKLAIEFWQAIGKEESELLDEIAMAEENGMEPPQIQGYIKGAANHLVPLLLNSLSKIDPDAGPDDFTVSEAAQQCLVMVTETLEDDVIPLVLPFIASNLPSEKWKHREAAILALGGILDGPQVENLKDALTQVVPSLLSNVRSPHVTTRDTAAWTIAEICRLHFGSIQPFASQILQTLLECLGDEPRVASSLCYGINSLAICYQLEDDSINPFTPNFGPVRFLNMKGKGVSTLLTAQIVQALLTTADRKDSEKENLRASAYKSLEQVVATTPQADNNMLLRILNLVLERLNQTNALSPISVDEYMTKNELLKHLISLAQVLVERLRDDINEDRADTLITMVLILLTGKSDSTVHEECLMLIGGLANVLDSRFSKYANHVLTELLKIIENWKTDSAYSVALGVVTDIIMAITGDFQPWADRVMGLLLTVLNDPSFPDLHKSQVISVFGDIALCTTTFFSRYLAHVLPILKEATETVLKTMLASDDYEVVESMGGLRLAILEAYQGILQGPCHAVDGDAAPLAPFVGLMMSLIAQIAADENRTEATACAAIGIVRDLASTFGAEIRNYLNQPFLKPFFESTMQSATQPETIETINLAVQEIDPILH